MKIMKIPKAINEELNPKLTYTVREAYSTLGISRALIYRLIQDGTIKSFRLGKKILISKSYIDSIVDNKTNK